MKKQKNYLSHFFFFAVLLSVMLFNCELFEPPAAKDPTPTPLIEPTPEPENLIGYWESVFGDGFEIITAGTDMLYQYDDADKTVSFAGEIVNDPDFSASTGYITVKITDAGTWMKTVDEYYVIHWQNLSGDVVEESCAYKDGGESTMPTQETAETEFTVENGYFDFHGEYERQPETKMTVPLVILDIYPQNTVVTFESDTSGAVIYTGTSSDEMAAEPDSWTGNTDITLDTLGTFKIFARATSAGMGASVVFSEVITVTTGFLPDAEQPGSDAISMEDSSIIAWATGYENYVVGEDCDAGWQTTEKALGQAVGDSYDILLVFSIFK
jgi:hypothetical protein